MPSIVKGIVISNIDVTGAFNIGDTYEVTPISTEKGYHGAGSSNTGYSVNTFNGVSKTNVGNANKSDENQTFTL
ncbi:spore germination protein [Ectobacillus funiculus]|jgi:hypothetical protein|uniref:Spore germination protein n=1 Tax=Ectobacillus funiculus TaxID=137993 RepID=A0ABV5W9J2_9BACI|nr:spore germination protein [Ectobacillus funiculus]